MRRVLLRAEVNVRERAVARGPGARGVGGGGGGEGLREGGEGMLGCGMSGVGFVRLEEFE